MGKAPLIHYCPECGKKMSQIRRAGGGHRCQTDGCDVQKCFYNHRGELIRIVRSTVPKGGFLPLIQRMSDCLLYDKGILVVEP